MTAPAPLRPPPQWQRARCLNIPEARENVGRDIWVRVGPPMLRSVIAVGDIANKEVRRCPSYESNLLDANGRPCLIWSEGVELLSGPEDFAESVELEDFSAWHDSERTVDPCISTSAPASAAI